jgi:hypothetical protein
MTHRHTKSCKHSGRKHTRKSGGKHHHTKRCRHATGRRHHHTKNCMHTKRNMRMKGGISDYPPSSTYPLGVKEPVSNFDFNAASYGSSMIPTSQPAAFPFGEASMTGASISEASMTGASMTGGKRRRHRSTRHRSTRKHSRKHRGGMGYSFLPSGSDLNAKDSYLANVAPYSVYNE